MYDLKCVSHLVLSFFVSFMVSYAVQKLFDLIQSNLFIFVPLVFEVKFTKYGTKVDVKELTTYVFFYVFYGFKCYIQAFIDLELVFGYDLESCPSFTLFHVTVQFFWFHANIRIIYFISVENTIEIVIGISLNI